MKLPRRVMGGHTPAEPVAFSAANCAGEKATGSAGCHLGGWKWALRPPGLR